MNVVGIVPESRATRNLAQEKHNFRIADHPELIGSVHTTAFFIPYAPGRVILCVKAEAG